MLKTSAKLRNYVCWLYVVCFVVWVPLSFFITAFGSDAPTQNLWDVIFIYTVWTYPIYTGIGMALAIKKKNNWWLLLGLPGPLLLADILFVIVTTTWTAM